MSVIFRRKLAAIAIFLLGCAGALAQSPAKPYHDISPPQLVLNSGKIEVVEVFSYACIHCAHFQPLVDAWRKHLDMSKVQFIYLPAPYNPLYQMLARGFYTGESLGIVEKTHQGVFDAIHVNRVRVASFDDVIDMYAKLGVPREDFVKASQSFLVETQTRRAMELTTNFRIDGTPTLVIAGKYRITAETAGDHEKMIKVADQLLAQEIAQTATSRQAPNNGK